MVRQLKAALLDDTRSVLGEGPSWDARTGELASVDLLSGRVFLHDADGRRLATYDVGGHVGSALPADEGGWLLVTRDGFAHLHRNGAVDPLLAVEADRPHVRFNDAKCDPWGQALAGTMRYDEAPGEGTLYRLEGNRSGGHEPQDSGELTARVLLDEVGLANGLGWSSDGSTLYFIDSLTHTVARHAYAPDGPQLGSRHVVVAVDPADGIPDGMCVDAHGNLWVALYGGGAVHCFGPDGQLDAVVHVPVPYTTSVAFGGDDGGRLFITTATRDGSEGGPGAGGLWAVDPGVTGAPATPWRRPHGSDPGAPRTPGASG
ncbi:MAG: SMP-30/gluconolactonase/LRE family protein [Acidimicrobiales bacterium]